LEIADLTGKTVYAGQFVVVRAGADRISVDLSDRIRRGAYMLRVVQGDMQYTEKLIVTE
jgi:hypothetical protein